jgi:hypothetical protein
MNTRESFDIPGITPADDVINALPQVPRPLTLVGFNTEIVARILLGIMIITLSTELVLFLYLDYINSSSVADWFFIATLLPIAFIFVPWALVHGIRSKYRVFEKCKSIYQNGTPTTGNILLMSYVAGNDYACYYAKKHKLPFFKKRVRIDYTFPVNDKLCTGTVFLREKNAANLHTDDEICVIYLPDHPENNILFPVPGREICSALIANNSDHVC